MSEGIKLTALGMGTVFFFLALLTLSIKTLSALFGKTAASPAVPALHASPEVPVAAIMAAVREYEREREGPSVVGHK